MDKNNINIDTSITNNSEDSINRDDTSIKKIKFYDYYKNKYIILDYKENTSIFSYTIKLSENNIKPLDVYFMKNFKLLNIYSRLENNDEIIIINKSFIKLGSVKIPHITKKESTFTSNSESNSESNNESNSESNSESNNENNNESNSENSNKNEIVKDKINIDKDTNKFLCLLEKYPDLISFIIILKTNIIDYIALFLQKYRKKNIYNIIRNNQKEIIDILENNKKFINMYIRTSNVNILQNIINYSYNNLIISQLENIFPDVPNENIEELIEIFS